MVGYNYTLVILKNVAGILHIPLFQIGNKTIKTFDCCNLVVNFCLNLYILKSVFSKLDKR